jgi:ketosteroid isomerase-like protein
VRRDPTRYDPAMPADTLRAAYEALGEGDLDPLVSLMSEDMVWQGRRNPWRFWQPVPA